MVHNKQVSFNWIYDNKSANKFKNSQYSGSLLWYSQIGQQKMYQMTNLLLKTYFNVHQRENQQFG